MSLVIEQDEETRALNTKYPVTFPDHKGKDGIIHMSLSQSVLSQDKNHNDLLTQQSTLTQVYVLFT